MPNDDVRHFLDRLADALGSSRLRITWKADDEISELGWSRQDALDQLAILNVEDLLRTEPSKSLDFGTIWVFAPLLRIPVIVNTWIGPS